MTSLSMTPAAAALFVLVCAGAATAQDADNTITILQTGVGNTLTVDQSEARGSVVGGLTIGRIETVSGLSLDPDNRPIMRDAAIDDEIVAVPVVGSASFRDVSFDRADPVAARQIGSENQAVVTVSGDGGFVGLLQENASSGPGNIANVDLFGSGNALIGQFGSDNRSDLRVAGFGAQGAIIQEGDSNRATLIVNGNGRNGSIRQLGDGNVSALDVSGIGGPTSVDYIVQGNNVVNANPLTGASVITNAPSVTITQTSLNP